MRPIPRGALLRTPEHDIVASKDDSSDNALAEAFIGLCESASSSTPRTPWCDLDAVEYSTLGYIDWFNRRGGHPITPSSHRTRGRFTPSRPLEELLDTGRSRSVAGHELHRHRTISFPIMVTKTNIKSFTHTVRRRTLGTMTTKRLQEALAAARPDLEAGLAEAESELAVLDDRRRELLALIAQGRAALGLPPTQDPELPSTGRPPTLHEAIRQVLRERGNEWTTARELADAINSRRLYRKRDSTDVEVNQIHARCNNYPDLFEKNDSLIRERSS